MTMLRHQKFQGLVLSAKDYRENDQMVKIFTDKFGIKTFLVRGVKKVNSKNRYLTLPFTEGNYEGTINDSGFSYVTTANNLIQFEKISMDITLNAYVTYIYDLVVRSFIEGEIQPIWFKKLLDVTNLINQGLDPEILTNIIEIQLLDPLGVKPEWNFCVVGGEKEGIFDFSMILSGIICSKHFDHDEHRLHLNPKIVSYLRLFSNINFDKIGKINVTDNTKSQLRQTLDIIYRDSVGIYPKSKKFIDQMYRWRL